MGREMGKREHQLCGASEMGSCYKSRTDVVEKRKGKNEKDKGSFDTCTEMSGTLVKSISIQ